MRRYYGISPAFFISVCLVCSALSAYGLPCTPAYPRVRAGQLMGAACGLITAGILAQYSGYKKTCGLLCCASIPPALASLVYAYLHTREQAVVQVIAEMNEKYNDRAMRLAPHQLDELDHDLHRVHVAAYYAFEYALPEDIQEALIVLCVRLQYMRTSLIARMSHTPHQYQLYEHDL